MDVTTRSHLVGTLESRLEHAVHRLLLLGGSVVPPAVGLIRAIVDTDIDTRSYPTYGPYW